MNITMTREELRDLLNVKDNGLKSIIKRGKLDERLNEVGYRLLSTEKIGRNTVYELLPTDIDLWTSFQKHYCIKKRDEHTIYTIARLSDNGLKQSRSSLLRENDIDISGNTAKRFDEILLEENAMKKDKVCYMLYNTNSNEIKEITRDEYSMFWRDIRECKYMIGHNAARFKRGEISEDTLFGIATMAISNFGRENGEIALKFDTYKEADNAINIIDMIKNKNKNRGA